ncbi:serine/threonine-protein kinase PknK [Polyangium aurulentum]|uniref:serine/threonine-protein kinase n=1 Tax=Polyangium aurulentum TaxID=2567896 RepID=UPI0010AE251E|nr:serine/threonine-protein kinase [Polyangium aurulentum]UQA60469.1 protein kinase [Polyangium aurulentum]
MTAALPQGALISGRFEIQRLVEHGGMGTIYRALDRADGRPVAIKLLQGVLDDPSDAERFSREVSMLAGIAHARIVRYVAHGETPEGQPYLAMQWLEGEDLRRVLARQQLSLTEALLVLDRAADALAAVHARGIVHRDLKPANLFLRGGSCADVVLLDFGIARRVEGIQRLTVTGTILGTPRYMAPEQASSDARVQPATDIYSLGCIFYECLTGRPPFEAAHVAGVLAKILFDAPESVRTLRPPVPEPWARLLERMMDKDPARRPQDAAALQREIAFLPPATDAPDIPETRAVCRPMISEDSGEQVLVCVLLATFPPATLAAADVDGTRGTVVDQLGAVRSGLPRFGFASEKLADGSVIAIPDARDSATDLARLAAKGALYMRESWPDARIAIATGRVQRRHTRRIGEAVDRAIRLLQQQSEAVLSAAATEGIWVDSVTAGLLDARFVTSSFDSGVLLRGERDTADEGRLLLGRPTPCVGREVDLAQLEGLMSRSVEEGIAQVASVLAPPGIGKSRLRHELLRRIRNRYPEAEILMGHGDPLTVGSPYVLVSDALRRHAGVGVGDAADREREGLVERLCRHVEPADRRRIGEFLGELCGVPFPSEESPALQGARSDPRIMAEQISQAFVDWLSAECAMHPVVIVLEDIQWGDVLTTKLFETALRQLDEAPLFVFALGRPEAKGALTGILSERGVEIALRPLSKRASEQLVKTVLGADVSPETLSRLVQLAGGNALFLEELIRAAAEGKTKDVPETVLAMLQARLSRLAPEARRALRAASILGEAFWRDGVQRICEGWGAGDDVDRWLEHLWQAELVDKRRQSRFQGDVEYRFRHALTRDAAYGLSLEADQRAGHLVASLWLEERGETDAMALARHAREGGDEERAVALYTRAAQQSLARNDLAEALARASKGIECGAMGRALGELESIRCVALYGLGDWPRSGVAGIAAIALVPPGSLTFCLAAEKLVHLLPHVGEIARFERLVDEVELASPTPEARSAYVRAVSTLMMSFAVVGMRERAWRCLTLARVVGASVFDEDPYVKAVFTLRHGIAVHILEPDPHRALVLLEQSMRDLTEAQAFHEQAFARSLLGSARMEMGDEAGAEEVLRSAVPVAAELKDPYGTANAQAYLMLTLIKLSEPEKIDEAERLAVAVLEANIGPSYEGTARYGLAGVAVARGEWARAESEARRACALIDVAPTWALDCAGYWMRALVAQGRTEEAAALAKRYLNRLEQVGGVGFTEIAFRVAAASALFQGGEKEDAREVLIETLRQIELRASKIPDAHLKDRYLHQNRDSRQAFALAAAWGVPG